MKRTKQFRQSSVLEKARKSFLKIEHFKTSFSLLASVYIRALPPTLEICVTSKRNIGIISQSQLAGYVQAYLRR